MYRERITITVNGDLLKAVDDLIDNDHLRNRSQTIEHLLKEGLGLHNLNQAFLFFEGSFEQSDLQKTIELCLSNGIKQFFISATPESPLPATEISALINQWASQSTAIVPADFGTGGALLLQKESLKKPFLMIWLTKASHIPSELLRPYTFHRQNSNLLTEIIYPASKNYSSTDFFIGDPHFLNQIPVGIVSLKETVFPLLSKAGKMKTYAVS